MILKQAIFYVECEECDAVYAHPDAASRQQIAAWANNAGWHVNADPDKGPLDKDLCPACQDAGQPDRYAEALAEAHRRAAEREAREGPRAEGRP